MLNVPIAIPERPRQAAEPPQDYARYGVNFWKMTRWESRSDEQRHILGTRLRRFMRWRVQWGDLAGDFAVSSDSDLWTVEPPPSEILAEFLAYVEMLSQPTRSQHKAALREYLRRHEEPALFRMVV